MDTFKDFYLKEAAFKAVARGTQAVARTTPSKEKESRALNILQGALDIAGIEPTVGMFADGTNTLISLLRAAAAKTSDNRSKHLINAGISSISLIPFADILKITKLRHLSKPAAKAYVAGARQLKGVAQAQKLATKAATSGVLKNLAKGARVYKGVTRAAEPVN